MHLIIICSRFLAVKHGKASCDYGDVAELSLKQYGYNAAFISRLITNLFIIFTQTGFLCVYVVFIWATIDHYLPNNKNIFLFIVIFISILSVSLTSNLRIIGYFSTFSSILQCTCLTLLFIYLAIHYNGGENLRLVGDYRTLPLFFGTAMFAFEGIAVILPVENAMKKPERFFMVIDLSMGFVCLLYITSGFLGYAAFGDKVRGSVTLNLPHNNLSLLIEFGYVVTIFLSYPIQFYVPMKIIERYLSLDQVSSKSTIIMVSIKIIFVLFTCIAAVIIPRLENLLSLSGSFAAASISLVFPSFFHFFCFKSVEKFSKILLSLDLLIVIVGLFGCILGTYAAAIQLLSY
uniref:Proton-coupled amino acid transporter 1 (Trinotate prediction) n=1 Tax=Myxobolus squamalis TaxID=59785 RepID=A0A6B2FW96_MYXSQ